jgi:hypothetical protein
MYVPLNTKYIKKLDFELSSLIFYVVAFTGTVTRYRRTVLSITLNHSFRT